MTLQMDVRMDRRWRYHNIPAISSKTHRDKNIDVLPYFKIEILTSC